MKRWKKILCGGLVLLLLLSGGVLWSQKENIRAIRDGLQYSSEEIEEKLQENQQTIQDAVSSTPEVVVRDVTEEEKQALKEGTITQEELAERLVESEQVPADANNVPPQSSQQSSVPPIQEEPEETPVVDAEYQKQVSAIVAEVYVLREQYTIELDSMFAAAKAEYKGMAEEDRTADKLTKWARGYIAKASQLERDCDDKMYDIIDRLDRLITENSGDPGLLDTVVNTYANEKSLKKAWYMSELEKRGLS